MRLTKAIDLVGPAGRLEAVLMLPKQPPVAAGVVCHAHPLYGGNLNMKVVFRAARTLQRLGVAALRFNFRGVGLSQGAHDGGRGELDDVRAAVDELEARFPRLPLVLGGFSFGSTLALRAGMADPRARALFALGFPASFVSDTAFLSESGKPVLFIQCENDPYGPGDVIRDLIGGLAGPPSVVILPGGDHLFSGRLGELEEALGAWMRERPWQREGGS